MTVPAVRFGSGVVAVTGASGFIGRRLCESLARDEVRVRGITRSATGMNVPGVETAIAADITDRDALRAALSGVSTVVHLAARVHAKAEGIGDPGSECSRINVDGTALLLKEAVAAGVGTFVFISSVKAVADQSDRVLTSDTPPQPVDAYGESKLEAERLVRVVGVREGLRAPILRLPNVYGPGMKANMGLLFRVVDRGLPLPLRSVRNRRSFAYVDNAVAAIRGLMTSPAAAGETVYVSDEQDVSTPELIRHIARALGRPARLFPFPRAMLRAVAGSGGLLSRFPPFHLTGDSLTAVLGSLFVDTSRLRETTGYKPPISLERGMLLTAEWFRSRSEVIR
ncbi:MAG: NAD-dependent epimerase/dehydratase family protein [Gemmatimonadaceae bacterium]|nr:NAD-dependent epimerase/dehydratase family protein [Gemmatimonadaceae bacterium]